MPISTQCHHVQGWGHHEQAQQGAGLPRGTGFHMTVQTPMLLTANLKVDSTDPQPVQHDAICTAVGCFNPYRGMLSSTGAVPLNPVTDACYLGTLLCASAMALPCVSRIVLPELSSERVCHPSQKQRDMIVQMTSAWQMQACC